MTCLLLVRHGESTWNAENRWQGQADPPLSARGEAQARAAGPALAELVPFDGVFCSPLQRAVRTAELLTAAARLSAPEPVPGLQERGAGPWTGLSHAEIDRLHPGAREAGWRPPGYEAEPALRARVIAALLGLQGRRLLVVVHEGVIRALDADPAPLPNLAARWWLRQGDHLRPAGPRLALAARHGRPPPPSV